MGVDLNGFGGGGAVEVEGDGEDGGVEGVFAGEFEFDEEFGGGATGREEAEGVVFAWGFGKGENAKGGGSGEVAEAAREGWPTRVFGSPVSELEVGSEPNFRVAGFGFPKEVESASEEAGEVGSGVGAGGGGEFREGFGGGDFADLSGGGVEEVEGGGFEFGHGIGDLSEDELAFGGLAIGFDSFHGGRAVEDKNYGVNRSTESEESAEKRSGDGEDEGGDGEGAAGEDEDMFEFLLSAGFAGGFEEKVHGSPFDGAVSSPVEEVDDDWDADGEKAPEHEWLEERHGFRKTKKEKGKNEKS